MYSNSRDGGVIFTALFGIVLVIGMWIACAVQLWNADWHEGVKYAIAAIVTAIVLNISLAVHWAVGFIILLSISIFWIAAF